MTSSSNNTQHTKGPWRIGDAGHTVFGPPQGLPPKIIASGLSKVDARLIKVAPELLEACKLAFENLSPKGDIRKDFDGHVTMAALGKAIHEADGGN